MKDRIVRLRLMIILLLSLFSGLIWLAPTIDSSTSSPYLQVHFFDVGQGDSTLIETRDGVQVLIDGGRDATILRRLAEKMDFADRDIDLVIATHPDSDHITGLNDVFARFNVGQILLTENRGESTAAKLYEKLVLSEGADIIYARRGQVYRLGASTTLEVLWPETDPSDMESNTSSIVVRLVYGEISFLLTGDLPKSIEEYLVLVEGENLASNVLKVGHHGSRTSTSELFLNEVRPEYAVISAGRDNSYGHPHVEVTDMLFNVGVKIYNTAEEGTITILSDGQDVWVE